MMIAMQVTCSILGVWCAASECSGGDPTCPHNSKGMSMLQTKASVDLSRSHCNGWCARNTKEWTLKCNWQACNGCEECTPQPSYNKVEGMSCGWGNGCTASQAAYCDPDSTTNYMQ